MGIFKYYEKAIDNDTLREKAQMAPIESMMK